MTFDVNVPDYMPCQFEESTNRIGLPGIVTYFMLFWYKN